MFVLAVSSVVFGRRAKVDFDKGPSSGIYNDRGINDIWVVQLILNESTNTADFHFILNNECGKRGFEFPKLWKIDNMDYTYNSTSHGISFLNKPEDANRSAVVEINTFFSTFGKISPPINATLTKDGSIKADVIRLAADMKSTNGPIDMDALYTELYQKNNNVRPEAKAVGNSTGAGVPVQANANETRNANGYAAGFPFVAIMTMTVLASGMLDWLTYI